MSNDNRATDLIVRIAVDEQDKPGRPLGDIADDILAENIPGIVSIRGVRHDGFGGVIETGPEYVA